VVNLTQSCVESNVRLGPTIHAPGDAEEILNIEKIALADEGVKREIAKLQLPEGAVVISDPWIYGRPCGVTQKRHPMLIHLPGSDGVNDDRRMYQCFLYMRDPMNPSNLDSNYYAFPLAISPVVDTVESKVIRIEFLPTGSHRTTRKTQPFKLTPPSEYVPEEHDLRTDLKPLNVIQPEGASFTVTDSGETGRVIQWQKWCFRVGFNQREGMVIYNVGGRPPWTASMALMRVGPI
jgi:primary-amine oxidase